MLRSLAAAAAASVVGLAGWPTALATTHRVPSDHATINQALDVSAFGDTVLVEPGIYVEVETRTIPWNSIAKTFTSMAFLADGVCLRSEAGPAFTLLDASGVASPPAQLRVIVGSGLASGQTRVEGFTLLGGGHPDTKAVSMDATSGDFALHDTVIDGFVGGLAYASPALYHAGSNIAISVSGCVIRNCRGYNGGAIHLDRPDLEIIDTLFENNEADGSGGAIAIGSSPSGVLRSIRMEGCRFVGNRAVSSGGAMTVGSGGWYGSFEASDCVFSNNEAGSSGALAVSRVLTTLVEDCVFEFNGAVSTYGNTGALIAIYGSTEVKGCTFVGNSGADDGSTMTLHTTLSTVRQNVFANSAGGAAIEGWDLNSLLSECNVFWGNQGGNAEGYVLSGTDREVDPQFCNPESGDFTVRVSSPCVEPGSLGCGQIGAFGIGCGTVSVESTTWARIKAQYR